MYLFSTFKKGSEELQHNYKSNCDTCMKEGGTICIIKNFGSHHVSLQQV